MSGIKENIDAWYKQVVRGMKIKMLNSKLTEKVLPYFLGLLAVLVIYSFKFLATRCETVFIYWMIFTFFIFIEIKTIRQRIREHYINSLFKRESTLYRLLRKSVFVFIVSLIITLPFSTSLLVFVFLSDTPTIILVFFDAIVFCYIYQKLKYSFKDTLIEHAQYIFMTWMVITINVGMMVIIYYSINFFTIEVFPVMSEEIPIYVVNKVKHACYGLQIVGRIIADFEMEIHSLRTMDAPSSQFKSYLTMFTYITTISGVPFVAISFILKSFIDLESKTEWLSKKGESV